MIDDLDLLTRHRPAPPPPSQEVRAAALRELEHAIVRDRAPQAKRARPPWLPRLGWVAPAGGESTGRGHRSFAISCLDEDCLLYTSPSPRDTR